MDADPLLGASVGQFLQEVTWFGDYREPTLETAIEQGKYAEHLSGQLQKATVAMALGFQTSLLALACQNCCQALKEGRAPPSPLLSIADLDRKRARYADLQAPLTFARMLLHKPGQAGHRKFFIPRSRSGPAAPP
jgi:hypothetical protein